MQGPHVDKIVGRLEWPGTHDLVEVTLDLATGCATGTAPDGTPFNVPLVATPHLHDLLASATRGIGYEAVHRAKLQQEMEG